MTVEAYLGFVAEIKQVPKTRKKQPLIGQWKLPA